jgi:hypothetical protein
MATRVWLRAALAAGALAVHASTALAQAGGGVPVYPEGSRAFACR